MVTAKERYYYTFRPKNDGSGKWDCHKWDVLGDEGIPTATYVVDPFFGGWRGECSCEAWITCKHIKRLQEMLQAKRENELPFLKWNEKHGWERIDI